MRQKANVLGAQKLSTRPSRKNTSAFRSCLLVLAHFLPTAKLSYPGQILHPFNSRVLAFEVGLHVQELEPEHLGVRVSWRSASLSIPTIIAQKFVPPRSRSSSASAEDQDDDQEDYE